MPYKDKEKNIECIRKYHREHKKEEKEYSKQYCKNHQEQRKEYYTKQLQYIQDYKLSKGCTICGYNENAKVLCFHHQRDKKFRISQFGCKSLEVIKKEMNKCILLCRSCHAKLHEKLKKENLNISY
ncbi:MAG: hypothetical protein MUP69_10455 [Candidatus Atribacteria bacterium]|nr:hypothetical protein [Candidatus Atribacteria bacterium]